MIRLYDYIFFQIYSYLKSKKWYKDDSEDVLALGITTLIWVIPIGMLLANVVSDLPDYKLKTYFFLLCAPILYRYLVSPKIRKDDYKVFRDRWGNEDPKRRRRNRWIILIVCITNIIIFPIVIILLDAYHITKP